MKKIILLFLAITTTSCVGLAIGVAGSSADHAIKSQNQRRSHYNNLIVGTKEKCYKYQCVKVGECYENKKCDN
jgi:hypothetical protein